MGASDSLAGGGGVSLFPVPSVAFPCLVFLGARVRARVGVAVRARVRIGG